jgi:hypothetical protein
MNVLVQLRIERYSKVAAELQRKERSSGLSQAWAD